MGHGYSDSSAMNNRIDGNRKITGEKTGSELSQSRFGEFYRPECYVMHLYSTDDDSKGNGDTADCEGRKQNLAVENLTSLTSKFPRFATKHILFRVSRILNLGTNKIPNFGINKFVL